MAGNADRFSPPPLAPLYERARRLVENIDSGVRGDWRDGDGVQGRCAVYRAQAARECAAEGDPYVRGGRLTARTLELVPVTIDPLHIWAANGIMPTFSDEQRREAWDFLRTQPPMQGHSHHTSMDYAKLIRIGVRGVLKQIDEAEKRNPHAMPFYKGMRIAMEGLLTYARRYRDEAVRLLAIEPSPARHSELQRIIDSLRRVPEGPAETFFDAVQSMLLLHFGSRMVEMDSAVGRLDFYLDEYYGRDLAAGRIARGEAAQWVQLLLAQLLELTRFSDSVVVGGCLPDARTPFCNDLTYFVLDAAAALNIPDPEIGFRWTDGHPRELMRRAVRCVRAGTSHPGFFYDGVAVAALERAGFRRDHAADYVNCNCVELVSAGRSSIHSCYSYLNLAKLVEILLNGGQPVVSEDQPMWGRKTPAPPAPPTTFATFAAMLEYFGRYVDHAIAELVAGSNAWLASIGTRETMLPLSSAFIEGCIETGRHAMTGGAMYCQTFPNFVGFLNAVDSLAAIRKAVFEDGRLTLEQLADACRTKFAGRELLRQYLLRLCPKYGNGDAAADEIAEWLYNRIAADLEPCRNPFGRQYAAQYVGWMAHARRGSETGATPDGRLAGQSVSGTLGGDHGTDVHGPTALLRSATRLDHTRCSGGLAVNLALAPSVLRTDEDAEKLIDLILAYFAMGGMQIQFNCVSADTLRAAQAQPERHRSLLVRVAGYTDRFTSLQRNLQDEIISRSEHGLV